MRSILLKNNHIRAIDRFFDSAFTNGLSPMAVMDRVLDTVANPPPEDQTEFTVYRMGPVRYRVEHQENGDVHYKVVENEESSAA